MIDADLIYERMEQRESGIEHIKGVCPTCGSYWSGMCRDMVRFDMLPPGIFHKSRIIEIRKAA